MRNRGCHAIFGFGWFVAYYMGTFLIELNYGVMHCESGPPAVLRHFMPADAYGKVNGGNARSISLVTHFCLTLGISIPLTDGVVLWDSVVRYIGSGSQTRSCSPTMGHRNWTRSEILVRNCIKASCFTTTTEFHREQLQLSWKGFSQKKRKEKQRDRVSTTQRIRLASL